MQNGLSWKALSCSVLAAGGIGTVRAANAAAEFAKREGTGRGGPVGSLTQLSRNFAMSRSPVQSYRHSMQSFQSTLQNTGSRTLEQIRTGKNSNNDRFDGKKEESTTQDSNTRDVIDDSK